MVHSGEAQRFYRVPDEVSKPVRDADDPVLEGVQGLLLDLDGTLAPSAGRVLRLWPGFLRHPRVMGAWAAVLDQHRGTRWPELTDRMLQWVATESGASVELAGQVLASELRGRWLDTFDGLAPAQGATWLIGQARTRGLPVGVVSDWPGLEKLQRMGIDDLDCVVDCSALGALKPHPDGLVAAAVQLGVPVQGCLFVGDRWDTDGAAALAAGCRFRHIDDIRTPIAMV